MTKKTRLRLQKEKTGRRVVKFLILSILVGLSGYQLDKQFEIVKAGRQYFSKINETFSPKQLVRGTIYDRNLKQLAVNMERVSVFVRTREIKSIEETAMLLSTVLQLDAEKFQNQLESGVLRLWVAEDISQDQEESIKNLALPGIYLQRELKRFYPNHFEAAHLLGYVEDGLGLSGVEYFYDRVLASRKLKQQKEQQQQSHAQDLVLTLDLKIQAIVEDIVRQIAEKENAFGVTAYLQESRNGEIIAGSHLPSFDPNKFTKYSHDVVVNSFMEPGYLPSRFRRLLRDAAFLFSKESNKDVSAPWSLTAPAEDLGSQLKLWSALGFDSELVPDFAAGTVSDDKRIPMARAINDFQGGFGTTPEILSPLQLLNACTILLGSGRKLKPHVVKKIIDIETDLEIDVAGLVDLVPVVSTEAHYKPAELGRLFDSQVSRIDSSALYLRDSIVLSKRTADFVINYVHDLTLVKIPAGPDDLFMLLSVRKYPEQVINKNREKNIIETIVDAKAERISILQQVALSVADVVEPELSVKRNYQDESGASSGVKESGTGSESKSEKISVMPDLQGLSLRKSLRLLQGIPLELEIEGTGRVIKQVPLPGTSLKGVNSCKLILASKEKEMFEELMLEEASPE